ncbi:MAG: 1-deoxy-D-xylulose-5-phosphate synthase [Oscillospiraceae bacterium]|nr:1-deoxy-D-xylulose-5-phosphate synthase [Oscillospiraceae bacterium]
MLDQIHSPEDVQKLPAEQLSQLCEEIRAFLVENVSKTGGHLASNLGAVELTVAIHRVYHTERDRLLFDVGHQSYVHKLLTGRKDDFKTLRQYGGMAGFPKPAESVHDAFVAGHASTSISVALGMARARTITKADYDVVALIGDGALTGGLAYEGLSDAGQSGEPLVIILNDNGMSIHKNVGGIATLLSKQRVMPSYLRFKQAYRDTVGHIKPLYNALHHVKESLKETVLPDNIFDDMGFYYIGPVDGHDEQEVERVLRWARDLRQPVLLHVITKKGKGIRYTEAHPERYHGVGTFDPLTGKLPAAKRTFSDAFGDAMLELAQADPNLVAMTAAMASGTGLETFSQRFPERFFDVGIAEGHAVTMSAAMAKQGLRPVFAVYSSFLQRSYDMLLHDVALQSLHVVLGIDRGGIVGNDGDTHNGCFDVSYLSSVPGMTLYCPSNYAELRQMLRLAVYDTAGPAAVRYPRGGEGAYQELHTDPVTELRHGSDVTIVTYGILINEALAAADRLAEAGISASVLKLGRVLPLDTEAVLASLRETGRLITVEDVCADDCVGQKLLAACAREGVALRASRLLNLGSGIVPHGSVGILMEKYALDSRGITEAALALCAGDGDNA